MDRTTRIAGELRKPTLWTVSAADGFPPHRIGKSVVTFDGTIPELPARFSKNLFALFEFLILCPERYYISQIMIAKIFLYD